MATKGEEKQLKANENVLESASIAGNAHLAQYGHFRIQKVLYRDSSGFAENW